MISDKEGGKTGQDKQEAQDMTMSRFTDGLRHGDQPNVELSNTNRLLKKGTKK